MIYVILTYILSPLLYLLTAVKKKNKVLRILVIQTAKIGDLICSSPVFREIKKKYPHAHLTAIVNPITRDLLENNPFVNEIITIRDSDYRGFSGKVQLSKLIRKGRYDIAICLNPNVPYAIALFWGLVPMRISIMPNFSGLTFKLASIFFSHLEKHIKNRLITETYVQMLRAVGIENGNVSKEVYRSSDAEENARLVLRGINKPLIGLAVSSGNKLKELGAEKIARLANLLLDNMDICIVLIGSGNDVETSEMVLQLVNKRDRIVNASGRLNLKQLPSLLEKLALFIGVDTGIAYMADALLIPIIHIAGPIDTSEQHPSGKDVIIIQNKLPCVPCTYVFKAASSCKRYSRECIESIDMNDIFKAAKTLLKV